MSDNSPKHDGGDAIAHKPFNAFNSYIMSSASTDQRGTSTTRHTDKGENESEDKLGDSPYPSESSTRIDGVRSHVPKDSHVVTPVPSMGDNVDSVNTKPPSAGIVNSSSLQSEQSKVPRSLPETDEACDIIDYMETTMVKWIAIRKRVQQYRAKLLKVRKELEDLQAQVDRFETPAMKTENQLMEDMSHIKRVR